MLWIEVGGNTATVTKDVQLGIVGGIVVAPVLRAESVAVQLRISECIVSSLLGEGEREMR